jgi:hypothetical protein
MERANVRTYRRATGQTCKRGRTCKRARTCEHLIEPANVRSSEHTCCQTSCSRAQSCSCALTFDRTCERANVRTKKIGASVQSARTCKRSRTCKCAIELASVCSNERTFNRARKRAIKRANVHKRVKRAGTCKCANVGVVWCDLVSRCRVVWYGMVVWCGVVWCGVGTTPNSISTQQVCTCICFNIFLGRRVVQITCEELSHDAESASSSAATAMASSERAPRV